MAYQEEIQVVMRLQIAGTKSVDARRVGELSGSGEFAEAQARRTEPWHARSLCQVRDFQGVFERGGQRFIDEYRLVRSE